MGNKKDNNNIKKNDDDSNEEKKDTKVGNDLNEKKKDGGNLNEKKKPVEELMNELVLSNKKIKHQNKKIIKSQKKIKRGLKKIEHFLFDDLEDSEDQEEIEDLYNDNIGNSFNYLQNMANRLLGSGGNNQNVRASGVFLFGNNGVDDLNRVVGESYDQSVQQAVNEIHPMPLEKYEKLHKLKYDPTDKSIKFDFCPICQDNFKKGSKILVLDCNHCLHEKCGKKWLLERNGFCPTCKK